MPGLVGVGAGEDTCPYAVLTVSQGRLMMGLENLQSVVDFIPVDYVPPGGEILGAAVVVLQVVGVFPDVVAQDGEQALRDGIVLVGSGEDAHVLAARGALSWRRAAMKFTSSPTSSLFV